MSFGSSIGDIVLIAQLASSVVQNARKACGAHDELTREVACLHIALRRLESETSNPQSLLNSMADGRKEELTTLTQECSIILQVLSEILEKYNTLPEEKRSITKLWQKVKFGNGEMQDLSKIRLQLVTYTAAITMFINTLSLGSQGKVEEYMILQGGELQRIRRSLDWITASMQASSGNTEGSILTSYTDDDKAIWKDFRRELIQHGYSSNFLKKHKDIIQDYVLELGQRGALDELTEGEYDRGEETQSHKGAPRRGEDSKKTVEFPVSLSETSLSATAEVHSPDMLEHNDSDSSDEASSTESNSTWKSREFDNCQSQKQSMPRGAGSEKESDTNIFNQQQHNTRMEALYLMKLSELNAELERTDQENEDVWRKLKLVQDDIQLILSRCNTIKHILFPKKADEIELSSLYKSLDSLRSRYRSIRKYKIRIKNQITRLHSTSEKATPIRTVGYGSELHTIAGVRSSHYSNHVRDQNPIPLPAFAPVPKSRTLRRQYGILEQVPNMALGNGNFSTSHGQIQSTDAFKVNLEVEHQLQDSIGELVSSISVTSARGFVVINRYIYEYHGQCPEDLKLITTLLDELNRPGEYQVRVVEKEWKRMLRSAAKGDERTPSREEFVAGVRLATQALIRALEIAERVSIENVVIGLTAERERDIKVLAEAIEELDRNGSQVEKQKSLTGLNDLAFKCLLLASLCSAYNSI